MKMQLFALLIFAVLTTTITASAITNKPPLRNHRCTVTVWHASASSGEQRSDVLGQTRGRKDCALRRISGGS